LTISHKEAMEHANRLLTDDTNHGFFGDVARRLAQYMMQTESEKINQILEYAATIAEIAPGQDWSDETNPYEMSLFISQVIRDKKINKEDNNWIHT